MICALLSSLLLATAVDDGQTDAPSSSAGPVEGEAPASAVVDGSAPIVVPASPVIVPSTVLVVPEADSARVSPLGAPASEGASTPDAPTVPPAAAVAPVDAPTSTGFFDDGEPGGYLRWYGAEYLAIAAFGTIYATGAPALIVPGPALIGPRVDLAAPDRAVLFDPRLSDAIGRSYLQEQVSESAVAIGAFGTLAGVALVDLAGGVDLHRTHALVVGGLEALTATTLVTELIKAGVGRLRPDFRERWQRAACAGVTPLPDGVDCALIDDGFTIDRATLLDGLRSFPSGHTSASFAAATFATLAITHRWLLNESAPAFAPPLAAAAAGTLLGAAAWVGATRVEDHRHHLDDVIVGAALGSALGAAAYYVHFDARGRARTRSWSIAPASTPGGGVGLHWTQPL